jgi:signal transduction histidine kinase
MAIETSDQMAKTVAEQDEWFVPLRPPEECSILVVDDEPSIVEIITFFLEKQGYQTLSATNGQEALELVRQEKPDVVVMDIMMPEVDGVEACRRIKGATPTHHLPVILVTSKGDTARRIVGKEAGADDFLDKPVNELELAVRVRALLRSKLLYEQVAASNRDLERRVAERTAELQTAYEQLQELDRFKSDVISNVSHELRTPLQHIKSSVSLLAMGNLPEEQAESIKEMVDQAVNSMVRLVDDIINLGEGSALRLGAVVMLDVIAEAVNQNRTVHRIRAEDLIVEIDDDLPPVQSDARALTRVIYHLLDNALKFSDEGTRVLLTARQTPDNTVRITVKDSGIGIPDDEHERVFEPFYQVDSSSTRRYSGAGMGLALVKLILDGHGTVAYLESKEDHGSTGGFDLNAADLD